MEIGTKIAAALVKAQKSFQPALKTSTNPHFRSRYADLAACVEAVIGALNENGIFLTQRNSVSEDGVTVETVFIHESGEHFSSGPLFVPAPKDDPQGYGSALTYARRYSLMAACGHAPEDDDGNSAASARRTPAAKPIEQSTTVLPPEKVAENVRLIGMAAADEIDDVFRTASAEAEKVKDRLAYVAFRTAYKKRQTELGVPQ